MESFGTGRAYQSPIAPGVCPHCGQRETVERVASLVAGGVTPIVSTIGRMPIVLGTGRNYGMTPRNSGGTVISGIPDYLRPPREPEGLRYRVTRHAAIIAALALIGLVPLGIGAVPSITRATVGDTLPTSPFIVVGALLLVAAFVYVGWGVVQLATGRAQRRVQADMVAYKRATERWNHLYCCTDCHCVFTPESAACIPHRRIHAYLYP